MASLAKLASLELLASLAQLAWFRNNPVVM
jgi:hypothetical protein